MSDLVKVCLLALLGSELLLNAARAQVTNATTSARSASATPAATSTTRKTTTPPTVSVEPPKAPARVVAADYTSTVRQLVEHANLKAKEYVAEQAALRAAAAKAATEEERARIRAQIQVKRDAFLAAQREAREDIQKRAVELRDQLKNHREVLDAAKEQTRERVKQRKGGGD